MVVTDIRMPPSFQREGIDAAKEIRQRQPGVGIVILSQYDDPEYAVSLLADGAAGYAYLLKDRLAEGDQLIDAIRAVATGLGNDAPVREVMSEEVIWCLEDDDTQEVLGRMADRQVRRIPVIDAQRKLVGIVALFA